MSSDEKLPQRSSGAEVDNFLRKVAAAPLAPQGEGRGRLIFAMDATASRGPTWDRACHIQAEMFKETEALGGLEVQLIYYRGYRECRASRWAIRGGHPNGLAAERQPALTWTPLHAVQ